jgi:hypothetical protein
MPTENTSGKVTSIDAAEMPQQPCKHIRNIEIPGQALCQLCGEQIPWPGLQRTRWQRFTAWVAAWFVFIMADNNSTTLPARRTGSADPPVGATSSEEARS